MKNFDIRFTNADELLESLEKPIKAVLLIEVDPSTAYNLALCVLEDKSHNINIVDRNIALESNHGGMMNTNMLAEIIKLEGIPIEAWVVRNELLDKLENDSSTWDKIKVDHIPLNGQQEPFNIKQKGMYEKFLKAFDLK